MATNKDINFNLNAKDRATEEIKKVNKSLDGLGTEAKNAGEKFKGTFTELNNKIQTIEFALGKFKQVFKTAFDWGEQGATVNQTYESFEMLLASIGAAPDLLEQLTEKSKGTISQLDLMSSTATLLAGASGELGKSLADATPELLEIAKAANKLNPALGDTSFFYESLATGIKRASPLLIDNLGIKLKIGEANERLAKQLGKTVEQLTVEEQQMALLNETLRVGGNIIEQVGGNTDSATDSFARMNVAIENASNALKAEFAPMMINAADAVTTLLTRQEKIMDATNEHTEAIIYSSESYEEYHDEIMRVAGLIGGRGVPAIQNLTKEEWELARATAAATGEDWALQEAAMAVTTATIEQNEATITLKDATNNAEAAMRTYTEALLFKIASEGLDEVQALSLAYAMGLVDEKTVYATEKTNEYKKSLDGTAEATEAYNQKIIELRNYLDSLPENIDINVHAKFLNDVPSWVWDNTSSTMGGGGSSGGGFGGGFYAEAAGGDVRPGQSGIVGEHGIEQFKMNYDGTATITPITNNYNNYNLGVTTMQNLDTVTTGFAILQAMQ